MTTPKRAPRSGANRRAFESPPDVIDRTVWARPERPTPAITLPRVTAPATTDVALGLPDDPVAQLRAEFEIRRAIARRLADDAERRAARDRICPGYTVFVPVPDDALTLHHPTDVLSPLEREIIAELERIATRPAPRWMSSQPSALAS